MTKTRLVSKKPSHQRKGKIILCFAMIVPKRMGSRINGRDKRIKLAICVNVAHFVQVVLPFGVTLRIDLI